MKYLPICNTFSIMEINGAKFVQPYCHEAGGFDKPEMLDATWPKKLRNPFPRIRPIWIILFCQFKCQKNFKWVFRVYPHSVF